MPKLVLIENEPTEPGYYLCRLSWQSLWKYVEVFREWNGALYAREAFARTHVPIDCLDGQWVEVVSP
jgi:hypothetical protein